MRFVEKMKTVAAKPGTAHLYWIGQAGFAVKTAGGKTILIDPYLSDSVYEQTKAELGLAFKRVAPPLFEPDELEADVILCSHEHEDHVDQDSIAALAKGAASTVYTNPASVPVAVKAGVPERKIKTIVRGDELGFGEFKLSVLAAQHGGGCPEALGFILDFGFSKIYYSGDTSYDLELLAPALAAKPEVALLPINGAFGNLNSAEAARLSNDLRSKACVPHHFWTMPYHLGSPIEFIEAMPKLSPNCEPLVLTPGELYVVK